MRIRITSSARKHGVSRSRVEQALDQQHWSETLPSPGPDPKILFLGVDDRGVQLEIVAVVLPGLILVIHAMPRHYRRSQS